MAGKVKTKYGVYYVYGNHDRQPYTTNKAYTEKQLDETIEKNGIHILKDSYTIINDEIILLGRDDAGWGNTSGRLRYLLCRISISFIWSVFLCLFMRLSGILGKGGDSAGRSQQVIYIINHYSVNLFGYGKNIINMATVKLQGYAVHNLWVSSLYSSGLLIMGGYIYFICNLFNRLKSDVAKSFLLSFNLHFFLNQVSVIIYRFQIYFQSLSCC